MLQQQSDRVRLESRYDIQFDLGPYRAEFAHCGHEPVETGMAFDGNPQFSCLSFYNACQITFCIGNLRQQVVSEA
ncbi:Uncharacterised protein [Neisseria meningitidis]|nr:Uncharacterised protein [Neisseria meningitidis]